MIGTRQRISSLEADGEWLEALALALDYYEGTFFNPARAYLKIFWVVNDRLLRKMLAHKNNATTVYSHNFHLRI